MARLDLDALKRCATKLLGPRATRSLAALGNAVSSQARRGVRRLGGEGTKPPQLKARQFSLTQAHVFFGYYDVSPFDAKEELLLACAASIPLKTPGTTDQLRVGFFDLRQELPTFQEFGTTTTWCWQQGCRLQWYPRLSESAVIYNCLVEGRYGCVVRDVQSGRVLKTMTSPTYAISPDGSRGLSLDFSRLHRLRPGYGYTTLADATANDPEPAESGIWLIDMDSGERELLHSLRDLAANNHPGPSSEAQHYVNHLLFNPSGNRFLFFHAWTNTAGRRSTRLLTSDVDGGNLCLHAAPGNASHYVWKNDEELLCSFVAPDATTNYLQVNAVTGQSWTVDPLKLARDGHPSFCLDGTAVLLDTYPDRCCNSQLLVYHLDGRGADAIHTEFIPSTLRGEFRCDLHPRIALSGKQICIDSVAGSRRVIKLVMTDWGRPGR